jgi:hypothetical protein
MMFRKRFHKSPLGCSLVSRLRYSKKAKELFFIASTWDRIVRHKEQLAGSNQVRVVLPMRSLVQSSWKVCYPPEGCAHGSSQVAEVVAIASQIVSLQLRSTIFLG